MPPPVATSDVPLWDDRTLAQPHAQQDKSSRVRRMFDAIAPTYERVNTWSSLGRDRYWRTAAVRLSGVRAHECVLDVACGTGDMVRAFDAGGARHIVGLDFAADMLRLATRRASVRMAWCQADALRLPFADASFDIVSCAFGVRNFQDLRAGLREMRRVLRPGGRAVIVEFSLPRNRLLRRCYRAYIEYGLPALARLLSGDRTGAYRYLPRSIVSFVGAEGIGDALREVGFARVSPHSLTLGAVHVYVAFCNAHSSEGLTS